MAQNIPYRKTDTLTVAVPAGTVSGDPLAIGKFAGIALTDRDSDGEATLLLDAVRNVATLTVEAVSVTNSFTHGSAVAVGDKLYVDASKIVSKDSSGTLIGYALAAITSGSSDDIDVLLASA